MIGRGLSTEGLGQRASSLEHPDDLDVPSADLARYTVVYYVHRSWKKCVDREHLESLGFPFPDARFEARVGASGDHPPTDDRIALAMKDLILDQDQHDGESGVAGL